MSLPKAQLVDPQGNMNLPGMTATGIVTASSLKGVTTGSATGLTGNPDLDVGIVTASSFVGQGDGHAANLTGTPQLNLGVTTSTGFIGDAVGKAAGLTGTPNLNVGLITATSFVGFVTGDVTGNITGDVTGNITGNIQGDVEGNVTGNVSGLARGLGINGINVWTGAGTSNLGVGVCTATILYGDASGMVGAGSSAYIAQNITATGAETIIDLSYGNLIYYDSSSNTTIGFASTSAAEQITFIRDTGNSYTITWPDRVKWNGDTTPTLADNVRTNAFQIFRFTTFDTGLTYNAWEEMKTDNDSFDLWNWGSNSRGQLADNTTVDRSSPIQVSSTIPWWGKIANYGNGTQPTGDTYAMAIKSDASLWSWGYNKRGSGGWNSATDTASFSSPVQIPGEWSAVARCYNSALGVKTDGTLWAWGTNDQGGNGTNNRTSYSSPTQVGTDTTWATGNAYSVARAEGATPGTDSVSAAIKTDGSLWMWGDNSQSTLGHDDTTDRSSPTQVPGVYIPGGSVHMERRTAFALNSSGVLKGWGQNDYGQLGKNSTQLKSDPQTIPGSWAAFDCGSSSSIAIKTDGTLWRWGEGGFGALGLNQGGSFGANERSSPCQVGTNTNWSKCGAGYNVGLATKTDGTLWAWGLYNSGCLGQNNMPGDGDGRSSPTQIPGTDWVGQMGVHGSTASILRGRNYSS